MRFLLMLVLIVAQACSAHIIQTGTHEVRCYNNKQLVLNAPIDRLYRLVFTGRQYELHLADTDRRVAVFERCEIQIPTERPFEEPP